MKAIHSPEKYQLKTLHKLIHKGQKTTYGIAHNFSEIKDWKDFQRLVPVVEYAQILPAINKILEGEKNVLWKENSFFSRSSGTATGKSKYIPVSLEGLKNSHIQTGKHFLSTYFQQVDKTVFFEGKGIVLTGCFYPNEFTENSLVADISALLYQYTDSWISYFKAVPLSIALLPDWEEKLEQIARISIPQNITHVSGVPTWMILLFKKVLFLTNKKTIAEVWPNLELIIPGGVDFAPYQQQFCDLIGKPIKFRNVYNASEGFFAFQNEDSEGLLIDLANEVFYEFEEEKSKEVFPIWEVSLEKRYAILVTTNSGLWRYKMGDLVEFVSLNPYKIKLIGRTNQFINAFGEELIQANTDTAIAKVAKDFGVILSDYTVAPFYISKDSAGFHQWIIAFEKAPSNLLDFAHALDSELQKLNSDYEAKRFKNLALLCLQITICEPVTFQIWLKNKQRFGVQAKIPRLSNDRIILEEILAILKA